MNQLSGSGPTGPAGPSLQKRLLGLVLGLVLLIWSLMAVAVWFDARHELDELLDAHLAQAAALLVLQDGSSTAGETEDESQDADAGRGHQAPNLHRYAPRVAFQVFHEGRLSRRSANAPSQPMMEPDAGGRFPTGLHTVSLQGRSWRVFVGRGPAGDVQVLVAEQSRSRGEILSAVLRGAVGALLLALPLLALAIWWAVRQGTRPLRELGRLLAQRSPQSLETLSLRAPPAEMQPLLAALNQLFRRIEALLAAERRFTADAAHELRTPIAAIRAQAQVARAALAPGDEALRQHALDATLQGCERAGHLVEQLLTLARLEQDPGFAAAAPPLELAPLARQVLADLAPAALLRGQDLSLELAPAVASGAASGRVRGDATLLAVLLRNLVDNGLRYSPAGARIRLQLDAGAAPGEGLRLSVADSGPGLAPESLARLGERFFRVLAAGTDGEASAPASAQTSGSGLGWSIVRRIAEVHGLRIALGRSAELGGLEVRLDFPP